MTDETKSVFWDDADIKGWFQIALAMAVLAVGLGSCSMMESFGEAAKTAAKCKVEASK